MCASKCDCDFRHLIYVVVGDPVAGMSPPDSVKEYPGWGKRTEQCKESNEDAKHSRLSFRVGIDDTIVQPDTVKGHVL